LVDEDFRKKQEVKSFVLTQAYPQFLPTSKIKHRNYGFSERNAFGFQWIVAQPERIINQPVNSFRLGGFSCMNSLAISDGRKYGGSYMGGQPLTDTPPLHMNALTS